MDHQISTDRLEEDSESPVSPQRHPIALEHSPEETIRRMRSLPERADKFRKADRQEADGRSRKQEKQIGLTCLLPLPPAS